MIDLAEFGRRAHQCRIDCGLTVASAARLYGHTRRSVTDCESGHTRPHPDHVRQLARAYGVDPSHFLEPLGYPVDHEALAGPDPRAIALVHRLRRLQLEVNQALVEAEELAAA